MRQNQNLTFVACLMILNVNMKSRTRHSNLVCEVKWGLSNRFRD